MLRIVGIQEDGIDIFEPCFNQGWPIPKDKLRTSLKSIGCRSSPHIDDNVLIAGEEVGMTITTGVEETCTTEPGSGCNLYKIIDGLVHTWHHPRPR